MPLVSEDVLDSHSSIPPWSPSIPVYHYNKQQGVIIGVHQWVGKPLLAIALIKLIINAR